MFLGLSGQKFEDIVKEHPEPVCVAKPTPGAEQVNICHRCPLELNEVKLNLYHFSSHTVLERWMDK